MEMDHIKVNDYMVSRGVYSQSEFDASALYIDGAD
jgi:hypothetical protein